jgi:CheY-like chemotaxis protein
MSNSPFSPAKVLVVEDYEMNSMILEDMLKFLGIEVSVATDGQTVMETIQTHDFDLILMDLQLPDVDGLELSKKIRKMKIKQPKIVACTANAAAGQKQICIEHGMDDYLLKPISLEMLRALLNKFKLKMDETNED